MSFQLPRPRGEGHPNSKLPNAARRQVRADWQEGRRSMNDLARRHGVDRKTISRIVHQPADWLAGEIE